MDDLKIVNAGQLDRDLESVADAIRGKTGTVGGFSFPGDFVRAVNRIEAGSSEDPTVEKDVNFYDYDGSLLYAYTLEEIRTMEALPPAPVPPKDYLLFEEWNWTLAQLQEVNSPVDVGAVYKPVDGRTYAVLELEEAVDLAVTMTLGVWYYGDLSLPVLTVDWGDGSAAEVLYATATDRTVFTLPHTYAQPGTYTVALASDASTVDIGVANGGYFVGRYNSTLKEIYLGEKARVVSNGMNDHTGLRYITLNSKQPNLNAYALQNCYNIRAVILPSAAKNVNGNAIYANRSLSLLSMPYGLTQNNTASVAMYSGIRRLTVPPKTQYCTIIENYGLNEVIFAGASELRELRMDGNYSVCEVDLPDSLQTLLRYCFNNCYSLRTLTIPENVTSIDVYAFGNTHSLKRLTFRPTTPPTVSNANAFTNFPAGCVIEVPAGTLEAYQNATNYTAVAAQMVEV